jgi:N-acetylmuramoyl-L-alanine amidase-like protein
VASVVALCAVAGPALSLSPYRPKPMDFELAPPSAGGLASATGLTSRALRAPHRFNLVGLRWRGRSALRIEIRARRSGGRWSPWARVDDGGEDGPDPGTGEPARRVSAPAWVGEADEVQYRISRRVPEVRLHFVNVKGTATAADRARTALRRTANAAVASVGRLFGARSAQAQAQPGIVPRAGWGAEGCPPRTAPDYGTVQAAFVHHTVNLNDYSREESPQIVLAICRYHRNSNGWNDIGYNFLVDRYGTIFEGRAGGIDRAVVGAQAQGYNNQTTGIANIGTFTSVAQTPEGIQAMARLIRWKLPLHGVPTSGATTLTSGGGSSNRYPAGTKVRLDRVIGHRDTGSTECPGDALYAQIPELRRLVAGAVPGGGTALTADLRPRSVRYGRSVRITGTLRGPDGAPLASKPLKLQVRLRRRWATVARSQTDAQGAFSGLLKMRANRYIRARFDGGGGLLPASSPRTFVAVRPLIGLRRPPQRGSPGQRLRLRGRVQPAKRRLYLVLQERRRGSWRTVGTRPVQLRRGRFSTAFVPEDRALYRFYLVARADSSTALGRSATFVVRVR